MTTTSRAESGPQHRAHRPLLGALAGAGGSASLGLLAVESPLAATGLSVAAVLSFLPWVTVFALTTVASLIQKHPIVVSGVAGTGRHAGLIVRPEEIFLVSLAVQTYLLSPGRMRLRWRLPEYLLLAYLLVQLTSSVIEPPSIRAALFSFGLLGFGVTAYLTAYSGLCTRRRLLAGVRVMLAALVVDSSVALAAVGSHVLLGTGWGLARPSIGVPLPFQYQVSPVLGLAYEPNILGSTSAAGALVFLALFRESNPVVGRNRALVGFWVCLLAMLASLSRGAWLGFAFGFFVFLVAPRRGVRRVGRDRKGRTFLLLAGLAGALVFLARTPVNTSSGNPLSSVGARAKVVTDVSQGTLADRIAEWRIAVPEVLRQSPLIGLGTNSYGQRHVDPTHSGERPGSLGNLYVRALYDGGLIGSVLLVAFLGLVLWPFGELGSWAGDLAPVARATTLGWCVLLVAYIGTGGGLALMWPWLLLGTVRASRALARDQHRRSLVESRSGPFLGHRTVAASAS